MRRLGLSLVLLSAALLLPSGAQAQVTFDPNSPAGKEYAIPHETARDKANGADESKQGDGQSQPFGEGITRPGEKSGKASSNGKGKRGKAKDSKDDDAAQAVVPTGSDGGGGSGGGPDEAGTNGALLTSGIALAVLLLGGGVAFLMRRGAFGTDT